MISANRLILFIYIIFLLFYIIYIIFLLFYIIYIIFIYIIILFVFYLYHLYYLFILFSKDLFQNECTMISIRVALTLHRDTNERVNSNILKKLHFFRKRSFE